MPGKHDPFLIRRDVDVRFDAAAACHVIVCRHAGELFACHLFTRLHAEQIDPHAIFRIRDLRWIAAVAAKSILSRELLKCTLHQSRSMW